jgi:hypothetical protein
MIDAKEKKDIKFFRKLQEKFKNIAAIREIPTKVVIETSNVSKKTIEKGNSSDSEHDHAHMKCTINSAATEGHMHNHDDHNHTNI